MTSVMLGVLVAFYVANGQERVDTAPGAQACEYGYIERGQRCIVLSSATDAEIQQYLIRQSISSYQGNCPCPYHSDRAGRRCGARSAYSRPGGRAPLCYPADVSNEDIQLARARHRNFMPSTSDST